MQVATLFRELASLLGATMDTGGGAGPGPNDSSSQPQQLHNVGPGPGPGPGPGLPLSYDSYNHPAAVTFSNKYKL